MADNQIKSDKKMFWELLLIGIALIAGGIFSLVYPKQTYDIILTAVGVVALVTSLAFVIRFIRMRAAYGWKSSFSLTLAIFSFAAGLLFLIKPAETSNFLMFVIGFWFIAYAVFALVGAFSIRSFSKGLFWTVMLLSLLMLAAGLVIVIKPSILGISIGILIGATMLLNGLEFVLLAVGDRLAERKRRRAVANAFKNLPKE